MGWIFLQANLCVLDNKNVLILENIQRPKIKDMHEYHLPPLPKIVAEFSESHGYSKIEKFQYTAGMKERLMKLQERMASLEIFVRAATRKEGVREVSHICKLYAVVLQMLEKEVGLEELCAALQNWGLCLPSGEQQKKRIQLHGPQSLYLIDFLPSFLASIYFMIRKYAKEMNRAGGIAIDLKGLSNPKFALLAVGRCEPKETQEYIRIINILGLSETEEQVYCTRLR